MQTSIRGDYSLSQFTQCALCDIHPGRIHHKAKSLQSGSAQDGLFPELPESDRNRSFSSINGQKHCGRVAFQAATVCKRKRQARESFHAELFENGSRNPRQSSACVHQPSPVLRLAWRRQIGELYLYLKHSHCGPLPNAGLKAGATSNVGGFYLLAPLDKLFFSSVLFLPGFG